MIPHARDGGSVSRPARPLVIPVILPALIGCPVALPRQPGRPPPPLSPAGCAAVHMPAVAPPVHPELGTAVSTLSRSDLQSTSTRSKNWTPPPSGRILGPLRRSEVCGAPALPPKGSERQLRAFRFFRPYVAAETRPGSATPPLLRRSPGTGDPGGSGTPPGRWRHRSSHMTHHGFNQHKRELANMPLQRPIALPRFARAGARR
jgi:hypothetical protein